MSLEFLTACRIACDKAAWRRFHEHQHAQQHDLPLYKRLDEIRNARTEYTPAELAWFRRPVKASK